MSVESSGFVINYGEFRMQEWLLKAELSAGAKLTYSVLACCAGGRDYVWPSQEYLAEKVSVSVRTLQRYLSELVRFGLIEKGKQYIKGQVRNIYRFLLHSVIGLSDKSRPQDGAGSGSPRQLKLHNIVCQNQHDKMSPGSESILPPAVAKLENHLPTDTTICPDQRDNLSPSLNKEETIKGKEYNPPTPLGDLPATQGGPDRGDSGKEGGFILESKEEEPDWIKAKSVLKADLTDGNFRTWIAPLIFERNGAEAILRCPNPFFRNWVQKHFASQINAALESYGLSTWCLDLMTEEQLKKTQDDQQQSSSSQEQIKADSNPQPDVDDLPMEEGFEKLYQAYPRGERRQKAFEVFQNLAQTGLLPNVSDLINAVKRAKNNNPTWQRDNGCYIPQLHKWLTERRWMD